MTKKDTGSHESNPVTWLSVVCPCRSACLLSISNDLLYGQSTAVAAVAFASLPCTWRLCIPLRPSILAVEGYLVPRSWTKSTSTDQVPRGDVWLHPTGSRRFACFRTKQDKSCLCECSCTWIPIRYLTRPDATSRWSLYRRTGVRRLLEERTSPTKMGNSHAQCWERDKENGRKEELVYVVF